MYSKNWFVCVLQKYMDLANAAVGAIFHGFWWDKMLVPHPRGLEQCFRTSIYTFLCAFLCIDMYICILHGYIHMYVWGKLFFMKISEKRRKKMIGSCLGHQHWLEWMHFTCHLHWEILRKVDQHTCIPYFFLSIHSSYPFSCLSPFKILLQVFERQSGSTPVMRWSTSQCRYLHQRTFMSITWQNYRKCKNTRTGSTGMIQHARDH